MKGWLKLGLIITIASCSFGCTSHKEEPSSGRTVNRAFYYWRNTFETTPVQNALLDSLKVSRIYLRLFDVDWSHDLSAPVPLEGVYFKAAPDSAREVVPVVYITQNALKLADSTQIKELGAFLYGSMGGLQKRFKGLTIREWQFDCDWTDGTKDKYFALLQQIKDSLATSGIQISATIRLHQIKYQQRTGVPPVDRGVMMYYNIGKVADTLETNSIYSDKTAANYMTGFDTYPIPLDVALPIFSWGVWFREGKLQGLIHGLRPEDIGTDFMPGINGVVATRDQFVNGFFIQQGDRIRLESMDAHTVMQAAQRLTPKIKTSPINVILYHLDVNALKGFTPYELEQIYSAFE